MLQNEVSDYISSHGIKKSFIAGQIGMSPTNFSLWLHKRLCINKEKEELLKSIISKS